MKFYISSLFLLGLNTLVSGLTPLTAHPAAIHSSPVSKNISIPVIRNALLKLKPLNLHRSKFLRSFQALRGQYPKKPNALKEKSTPFEALPTIPVQYAPYTELYCWDRAIFLIRTHDKAAKIAFWSCVGLGAATLALMVSTGVLLYKYNIQKNILKEHRSPSLSATSFSGFGQPLSE